MRILTVSLTPWAYEDSFGNSYSSLFEGRFNDCEFADIYCGFGSLHNSLNMRGFQITSHSLIENLKNPKVKTGSEVLNNQLATERNEYENKNFTAARKLRWQVLYWARDFLWAIGRWKSPELKQFISDFNPDVIIQPVYYSSYMNDIACFVKEYCGAPMACYISDDNYSLRQFNLSPLYWIDRLWKRQKVKKTIEKSKLLYVITQTQKEEYEKIFSPPCKILTKGADFSGACPQYEPPEQIVKLLYAGYIGYNRWKSLSLISKAVEEINAGESLLEFDIYTPTPLTTAMKKALLKKGTQVHKPVSYAEILELQKRADVLVHAEGLDLKSRLAVHQSLSTKIVDFFALGKCIFAVGTDDEASIKHLRDNDAALIASSCSEVHEKLMELVSNKGLISQYGEKAWNCGKTHHDIQKIQKMLRNDLEGLAESAK